MARTLLLRIAACWIICVLVGSFIPGSQKDAIGTFTPYQDATAGHVRWQHRAAHFLSFGGMALLLVLAARTVTERISACLGVMALGLAIELCQYHLFRVGMEWWDVRDDALAALIVLGIGSMRPVRLLLVRP